MKIEPARLYLLLLIVVLVIISAVTFCLGLEPNKTLQESASLVFSNLTSEIIGALIGLLLIGRLLELSKTSERKVAKEYLGERANSMAYEATSKLVKIVSAVENNIVDSGSLGSVFDALGAGNPKLALEVIPSVFTLRQESSVKPEAYLKASEVAYRLHADWSDFALRYNAYFEPKHFVQCEDVLDSLSALHMGADDSFHGHRRRGEDMATMLAWSEVSSLVSDIKRVVEQSILFAASTATPRAK